MTSEYEEAKRLFSEGQNDEAWAVAQTDPNLAAGATQDLWEQHMTAVLATERRNARRTQPTVTPKETPMSLTDQHRPPPTPAPTPTPEPTPSPSPTPAPGE